MKRNCLVKIKILLLFLCNTHLIYGQGLISTPWNQGGDQLPQGKTRLGSLNCADVVITSNNCDRVLIECSGLLRVGGSTVQEDTNYCNKDVNVAVGSGSSSARLSVTGFANKSSAIISAQVAYKGNSHVSAITANSNPAIGYGYGILADGGRRAVYANNYGGSSTSSTYGSSNYSYGSAGTRYGTYSYASGSGTAIAYGSKGYAYSSGSGKQYGVYGETSSAGTGDRFAVYGKTNSSGVNTNYAGYFQGVLYASTIINGSDRKLKENIKSSTGVLNKLMKLNPSEYTFKKEFVQAMSFPDKKQHGLIADEVEKIFPELVSDNVQPSHFDPETDEKVSEEIHFKGINYTGFIPILIQSVKEQQTIIEQYKAENELLKSEMADIKNKMAQFDNLIKKCCNSDITEISKNIPNSAGKARLEQNTPNPFSSTTEIRYSIPQQAYKAGINIYGNNAKPVLSYNLTVTSDGLVVIPAGSLSSGEYIYELVVDGQRVDSKIMIITR